MFTHELVASTKNQKTSSMPSFLGTAGGKLLYDEVGAATAVTLLPNFPRDYRVGGANYKKP